MLHPLYSNLLLEVKIINSVCSQIKQGGCKVNATENSANFFLLLSKWAVKNNNIYTACKDAGQYLCI